MKKNIQNLLATSGTMGIEQLNDIHYNTHPTLDMNLETPEARLRE